MPSSTNEESCGTSSGLSHAGPRVLATVAIYCSGEKIGTLRNTAEEGGVAWTALASASLAISWPHILGLRWRGSHGILRPP